MTQRHFTYLRIFLLIAITFSPSRTAAQLLPFALAPFVMILYKKPIAYIRPLIGFFVALFTLSGISALYNASSVFNWGLGVVTWFGGILCLIIGYKMADDMDLRSYLKILFFISFIQIPVGLYQMFSFNNFQFTGLSQTVDVFGGTLLVGGKSSHIVGVKLAMSLILGFFTFKYYGLSPLKRFILLLLFITGWIMPSAAHSFLCFILAVLTLVVLYLKNRRMIIQALIFTGIIITMMIITQEYILINAKNQVINAMAITEDTPHKVLALYSTLFELPENSTMAPVIGLGLGRYSSFAALVLTGEFLPSKLPFLPILYSEETSRYILPYWNKTLLESNPWAHGVVNQPYFTYMSIYGELGIIGLAIFLLFWLLIVKSLKDMTRKLKGTFLGEVAMGLLLFTLFLTNLFFFDNWFEDARLMIPYFLTLGIFYRKYVKA
jgi:hypothetical protein